MNAPTFENYGGPNGLRIIDAEGRSWWYSYTTLVAVNVPGSGLMVSENLWSTTTGKHLNAIDGGNKAARLPRAEFEARVAAL